MRLEKLLTAVMLLASACQEKITSEYITAEDNIELSYENSVSELVFTTNTHWKVTSNAPWCTVYPNSGSGRYETENTLKLICDENTGHAERVCELTIEYGNQKKIIFVKQNTCSLVVYDKLLKIKPDESTIALNYWTDEDIQIETDPDCSEWISILPDTKSISSHTAHVKINENTSASRTGKIYLRGKNKTETIEIQQHAANIKFKNDETRQILTNTWKDYYDEDKDGEISVEEAAKIKEITVYTYMTVQELSYFTSLEKCYVRLYGGDYKIQENSKLKELSVCMPDKDIKDFKIAESVPISDLSIVSSTNIQSIDLRENKTLSTLFLSDMQMSDDNDMETVINLDGCTNLRSIGTITSAKIKELSLRGTENLRLINVGMTNIRSLYLDECTTLESLYCSYCENLLELDVSSNKQLQQISFYTSDEDKKRTLYLSKDIDYKGCEYNKQNTTVIYR